ncbi:hypothetical protein VQ042_23720 [Aurantimonas sp. A2-1-M11]|uniref:hypothetical protein n=1 Tax=Aurantimonas sp. A2-1-M11 TaxID=3113712 RepID=UPI002F91E0FD
MPRADGLPQVLLDFEVIGTFTRSLRDTALLDTVLAGPERVDPRSRLRPTSQRVDRPQSILLVERIDLSSALGQISSRDAAFLNRAGAEILASPTDFTPEASAFCRVVDSLS